MSLYIYEKKEVPPDIEFVTNNNLFFDTNVELSNDEWTNHILKEIDKCVYNSKTSVKNIFTNEIYNYLDLSTGCKTLLNILYNPDKIFSMIECGDNAYWLAHFIPNGKFVFKMSSYPYNPEDLINVDIIYNNKNFKSLAEYVEERCWRVKQIN